MDKTVKYLAVLTINGGTKGGYTLIETLEAHEGDTRQTMLFRMLGLATQQHGIPLKQAGITFFYLEPMEL